MIVLSAAQVRKHITLDLAYRAVEAAFIAAAEGSGSVNPVVIGRGLREGETYSIKSGAAAKDKPLVGLKVGTYWPRNDALGLPRHGSSILLLDPNTGRILAIVDATFLNGFRTAAANAVAAACLARLDAATLSILGAGHQAMFEARALCAIRPIKRMLIASRTSERALKARVQLQRELRVAVDVATTEHACREADILVTVTPSRAPLFDSRWIKSGTHIAAMGADQVGKQEVPLEVLRQARLFCDLPSQAVVIGEFQHVATEIGSGERTLTAIGDVLRGVAEGRRTADEITVFDSSGLALQDLFVAARILDAFH